MRLSTKSSTLAWARWASCEVNVFRLLQEMPPSSMRDAAALMLGSENPGMQVMALSTLVTTWGEHHVF